MKNILNFVAVLFVAMVAFGGWYGGTGYRHVDDGVAQLAVTEMVYLDEITVNPTYFAEVATTGIAEEAFLSVDSKFAFITDSTNAMSMFSMLTNPGKINYNPSFLTLIAYKNNDSVPVNSKTRRDGADLIGSTLRYRA